MAVFGGIVVALVVGVVGAVFGFGFGGSTDSPVTYWVIATATPAGALLLLYLACWKAKRFQKGVLIGLCVATLLVGLCNVGMTNGFHEVPRIGR